MTESKVEGVGKGYGDPETKAGRETHTLLHQLSSQMKTCEMVPCPFAGLAHRTEVEATQQERERMGAIAYDAGKADAELDVERLAAALRKVAAHTHKHRISVGPLTVAKIAAAYLAENP